MPTIVGDNIWETGSPNKTSDVILSLKGLPLLTQKSRNNCIPVWNVWWQIQTQSLWTHRGRSCSAVLELVKEMLSFSPCGASEELSQKLAKNWFLVVQSLSHVWLFVSPWTAPLSSTTSRSLLRFMSIELGMPSDHLTSAAPFSFYPQSFPASGTFPMSWLFASDDQNTRASALASVLSMSIQDWFSLGLTDLISLLSKRLSGI